MIKDICICKYNSPCGELILGSYGEWLCLCDWVAGKHRDTTDRRLQKLLKAEYKEATSDVLREAVSQLDAYFTRRCTEPTVPILFVGSDFQKSVWHALSEITYGETISYGELAHRIGRPEAIRAVANAVGANPISIFVPCHRIIGSDHSLTGYAGGLHAKQFLLQIESRTDSLFSL